MKISVYRSAFSSFDPGITLIVESDNVRLEESFSRKELAELAHNLLDVADDCIRKLDKENSHEVVIENIGEAMSALYLIKSAEGSKE